MAHGKETPRQKMIGMMYLVLTALLALNVSKDVLDAFVIVDEGLTKTTKNFVAKNKIIYQDFDQRATENANLALKWKNYAYEVKKKADQLTSLIQDLKIRIVNKSEGPKNKAVKGDEIDGIEIGAKDNKDVPGEIMVGSNNQGEGVKLKAGIKDFREYLLSLEGVANAPSLKASLGKELDTEDPPPVDNVVHTWVSEHFEHLPLIAVITIMSSLQANIRNAEADMLTYLYTQIDANAFKFNQLEAEVIPKTDYVLQGDPFEAQIFLAAFDTTQPPRILIGQYETKVLPDGSLDYTMKHIDDSIRIFKDGKGIYTTRSGSLGERKWSGLIILKSPGGGPDIKKPFNSKYTINVPNVTVSATKMNVFYRAVDNPVSVGASGFSADKINISLSNGTFKKQGGLYMITPTKLGNAVVNVIVTEESGKKREMGHVEFRVKDLPDPVAKIGGRKGGSVTKGWLTLQSKITAELDGVEFDYPFHVSEFTMSFQQGVSTFERSGKGELLTTEMIGIIKTANSNQRVRFEDIKVVGPEGTPRTLGNISFKIN